MQQHRIEIRRVGVAGDPRLSGGWEMYVDGFYAGRGPDSSRDLMEEMAMLHSMVAAAPEKPEGFHGR